MLDAAFPFWAERAAHPETGFHEALDLQGEPVDAPSSRVRVQARQTYCFALAQILGWDKKRSSDLVAYGVQTLRDHCRRDDGLYGQHMSHQGGLSDDTALLYDTAFALLGFSFAARIGAPDAARSMIDVSNNIEAHLARPLDQEGYVESLPYPQDRNQNPHMHLFEASLAQYEVSGDADIMARAAGLEGLMRRRFYSADIGGLRERFAGDWSAHTDDHFETGHQYEWVWLLQHRARLTGQSAPQVTRLLYGKAMSLTGGGGEVYLEHHQDGSVRSGLQRCWGLTEALKAHLVQFETGDEAAGPRAIAAFDRLWSLHIAPAIEGGWIDRYDAQGQAISTDMPASTGYHVFLAFAELERVAMQLRS